jgi:hypothetical protein
MGGEFQVLTAGRAGGFETHSGCSRDRMEMIARLWFLLLSSIYCLWPFRYDEQEGRRIGEFYFWMFVGVGADGK